ncbi:hypothetical protein ACMTN4_00850 (plasmid) [Rhodococcus globerulus]|uniref:hypothetical protein n=1 Tax=Rhodococcus globerulus TaxID=33008 RepID=UPI0039E9081C
MPSHITKLGTARLRPTFTARWRDYIEPYGHKSPVFDGAQIRTTSPKASGECPSATVNALKKWLR